MYIADYLVRNPDGNSRVIIQCFDYYNYIYSAFLLC